MFCMLYVKHLNNLINMTTGHPGHTCIFSFTLNWLFSDVSVILEHAPFAGVAYSEHRAGFSTKHWEV